MPCSASIFLRHATNRYDAACLQIAQEQAPGKMPKHPLNNGDPQAPRPILPNEAQYDEFIRLHKGEDFGDALVLPMNAIEREFAPLQDQSLLTDAGWPLQRIANRLGVGLGSP